MAYNAWSVVFGELPTAAKWNQLGENDAGLRDGTNLQINNNQNIIWRNQADSANIDGIKIGTDNFLRLSQIRYQKDDADSIASSTEENLLFQFGWVQKVATAVATVSQAVTFPTAFTTLLYADAKFIGNKASSADDITDFGLSDDVVANPYLLATTGLTVVWTALNGGNLNNGHHYGASWIAIGK